MKVKQPPSELQLAMAALRGHFVRAGWFSLACSVLLLVPTWYMLEVYGRVVNSRSHLTLVMVTALAIGAYVVMEVLEWVRSNLMHAAGLTLDKALSERVFLAIFEANLRHMSGGASQAMGDLRTIRDFLSSPAVLAVMETPVALVFLGAIFMISPVLWWAALAAALVQVFIGWSNDRRTQPTLMQANRALLTAQQYADSGLRNAQVIEAMGMVRNIHRLWMVKQREFLGLQVLASVRSAGYNALSKLTQNVVGSMLLGLSCWLLLHNQLTGGAGMLIAAGILGGRALSPLVQVVAQWRGVIGFRESWGRVEILLSTIPPKPVSMALPAPRGILNVDNVIAVAPGGSVAILKGISFDLEPGEVLVVAGASAAGKTTLARLLVGLWPASNGKVRLDDVDVFTWNKDELGPHLGYLPQGVELFEGTIAENISRFGVSDLEKVMAAATAVGLHEYILSLPRGYDSPVGEDGVLLSGGMRQRVGLARALYGNPVLVVLDEPNSSLDEAGDAALAKAIVDMKARGTTFVVMTHRTSVFAVADKLLVLHDGRTLAWGPIGEVMAGFNQANAKARQTIASENPTKA